MLKMWLTLWVKHTILCNKFFVRSTSKRTWYRNLGYSNTGQPRYVKLAYLEYTAYVEVIIHTQIFPYIAL